MFPELIGYLRSNDIKFIERMAHYSGNVSKFSDVLRLSALRRKAINSGLWSPSGELPKLRIAILGGCTLYPFNELLEHYLEVRGIPCRMFIGEFNNYASEILEQDGALQAFHPEVVVLIPSNQRCQPNSISPEPEQGHRNRANDLVEENLGLCQQVHAQTGAEIILANYLLPARHDPGPFRGRSLGSQWAYRKLVNLELGLRAPSYVQICDVEFLGCRIGNLHSTDPRAWYESKQNYSPDMTAIVAFETATIVQRLRLSPKKVLVMDLDNTLWGGVIGDDGMDGIELGGHSARGEAFKAFQAWAHTLMQRGVLLAVCSKNDHAVAMEPFQKHPEMILKAEDIISFKANWKPKSENLIDIASELNLGLDSLVFVDDNPAEIEIVRQFAPEVEAILLGSDPSAFIGILEDSRLFEPRNLTEEDRDRVNQYQLEKKRTHHMGVVVDMPSYLRSLKMEAYLQPFCLIDSPRIAQLINKSNQFNLTTKRRTEGEVENLIGDRTRPAFAVRLSDQFGDLGLISVIICELKGECLDIDTWLMSCRVLKRQVEDVVLNKIVEMAQSSGCSIVTGRYIPTAKNSMVQNLLPNLGFKQVGVTPEGGTEFVLDLVNFVPRETEITLKETAHEFK